MKKMRAVLMLLMLGLMTPVYAAIVPTAPAVNQWTQIGSNPCNGRCTARTMLDYLAEQEDWPPAAIAYFRERFNQAEVMLHLGYAPGDIPWTRMDLPQEGWSGVVSFGDNHLAPNTKASLDADAEAYGWSFQDEQGVTYVMWWVQKCTNYAADSSRITLPPYYRPGRKLSGYELPERKKDDRRVTDWGPGNGYLGGGGGGVFPGEELIIISHTPGDCACTEFPSDDPVAPIPLPAALPLLLAALAALVTLGGARHLSRRT